MSDRWQLNEEDLWAEEPGPEPEPSDDLLRGRDPEGAVEVAVTGGGEVRAVRLAADWKHRADPRSLGTHVVSAANDAALRAASAQAEAGPAERGPAAAADETPLTAADALALIDEVSADIEAFQRRLQEVADTTATAESAGGHVRGTARRGQVLSIEADPTWCSSARNPEVEGELTDVLRTLRARSAPAEVTAGPQSPAIDRLQALAADPQRLLRRLGLVTEQEGRP